jgi:hypothetical protein
MMIENWSHRVDLAVANSHLIAFEIKSAKDKLTRLPKQLAAFQRYFDKVVLVSDEKHIQKVITELPHTVELWSVKCEDNHIRFRVVKRARLERARTRHSFIKTLRTKELRSVLAAEGVSCGRMRRKALEELALQLSIEKLSSAALNAIKARYTEVNSIFWKAVRGRRTSITQLKLLSRYIAQRESRTRPTPNWSFLLEESKGPTSFEELARKQLKLFGDIPEDIQKTISSSSNHSKVHP